MPSGNAGAELLRALRPALFLAIGQQRADRSAGARNGAGQGAEHAAAYPCRDQQLDVGARDPVAFLLLGTVGDRLAGGSTAIVDEESECLGPGKESDDNDDQRNAVHQVSLIEGEPEATKSRRSDGRKEKPDADGEKPARGILAEKAANDGKTEDPDGKQLARSESERHISERGPGDDENDRARGAADHARIKRNPQRAVRETLPGHGISVEHGHGGGSGAGRAYEDRRDRASIFDRGIDGDQEQDRLVDTHGECHREQKRQRLRAAEARERAQDDADGDAGQHRNDDGDRIERRKGRAQVSKIRVHDFRPPGSVVNEAGQEEERQRDAQQQPESDIGEERRRQRQ